VGADGLLERVEHADDLAGGAVALARGRDDERAAVVRVDRVDDEAALVEAVEHACQGRALVAERSVQLSYGRRPVAGQLREQIGLSLCGHAYLAATELDLAAVAVLYGGWIPTADIALSRPEPTLARTAGISGRVLALVGESDHAIPPEHRRAIAEALRADAIRHDLVEYPGASHGFLCDRRDTFDPAAAEDAWRRIEELLTAELD
jgi:acetyl esterase/lipase